MRNSNKQVVENNIFLQQYGFQWEDAYFIIKKSYNHQIKMLEEEQFDFSCTQIILPTKGQVILTTDLTIKTQETESDIYTTVINYLLGFSQIQILKQNHIALDQSMVSK